MARKKKLNVAKEIRAFMDETKVFAPKAVVDGLAQRGVKTTTQYVSTIKNMDKKKGQPGKGRGRRAAAGEVSVAEVEAAKTFATSLGGVSRAKEALEAYGRIVG